MRDAWFETYYNSRIVNYTANEGKYLNLKSVQININNFLLFLKSSH